MRLLVTAAVASSADTCRSGRPTGPRDRGTGTQCEWKAFTDEVKACSFNLLGGAGQLTREHRRHALTRSPHLPDLPVPASGGGSHSGAHSVVPDWFQTVDASSGRQTTTT